MVNANICIAGQKTNKPVPNQLGAILYIPDLNTPVNGYWVDKSGKGKLIQAATTTVANDSLIMPANDADIITALTLAGAYSKYYTNDSTPKKVLISQIASIDSKYAVFFDAKTKTKFSLFKTQGDEARADKMYEFTFKAYTGGYFPITQTSDSISFIIRGTGTHIFDWGDGTTTSYTLTPNADTTISHTWTTTLGQQKNISVTGDVKNWTKFRISNRVSDNEIIRITSMSLSNMVLLSSALIKIIGSISEMSIDTLVLASCSLICISGNLDGSVLSYLTLDTCPLVSISGSISNKPLTNIALNACPLVSISGSITNKQITNIQISTCQLVSITGIVGNKLTYIQLLNCPLVSISGSITGNQITYIQLYSCPLVSITGAIEACSTAATVIDVRVFGVVYNGGVTKAWNISLTITAGWESAMVDSFINAFALTAPTVSNKTLNLRGSNAGRTNASDASVEVLTTKGWITLTNNGVIGEGDSILYGTGASPTTSAWFPLCLQSKGVVGVNNGIPGQLMIHHETGSLLDRKETVSRYTNGNTMIIALGTNDFKLASVQVFIEAYREFLNYITSAKNWPTLQLRIVNIYYSTTSSLVAVPYNDALLLLANEFNIKYLDVYTNCQGGGDIDGVHPNNARHLIIANYIASQIV